MNQDIMNAAQKRRYVKPSLFSVCLAPFRMLADSDPDVYKTSERARTEYGALVRGRGSWDDDWE